MKQVHDTRTFDEMVDDYLADGYTIMAKKVVIEDAGTDAGNITITETDNKVILIHTSSKEHSLRMVVLEDMPDSVIALPYETTVTWRSVHHHVYTCQCDYTVTLSGSSLEHFKKGAK